MVFWILFLSLTATLSASFTNWELLETDNYRLYYYAGHHDLALQALNELEHSRPLVQRIIGTVPEKFPIILEDMGQQSNGYVTVFPERMSLWLDQPAPYSFSSNNLYSLRLLATHELTHMAHLTTIDGANIRLHKLFGSPFYMNIYSPAWWTEGLAVYAESQNSPYEGRLNDAYTHAYFKAVGHSKTKKTVHDMTFYGFSYENANTPYLYGGRFVEYLCKTYGELKLQEFIWDYGSRPRAVFTVISPSFGFEKSAKTVYGKSFKKLVSEWQNKEISQSTTYNIAGELLTDNGWYKSFLKAANGQLFFLEEMQRHPYPFIYSGITKIKRLDPKTKKITVVYSSDREITLPFTVVGETLYFAHAQFEKGYENIGLEGYGTSQELHKVNLKTLRENRLFSDKISAFTVGDLSTITYVTHEAGKYTSKLKQRRRTTQKTLATLPIIVSEIEQEGSDFYCVGKGIGEPWNIYKIDGNSFELSKLVSSPYSTYAIQAQKDGIVFTSDLNKTRQTYKYFFSTKKIVKLSAGDDAAKGVVLGNDLYVTVVGKGGENILHQEIVAEAVPDFQKVTASYTLSNSLNPSRDVNAIRCSNLGLLKPKVKLGLFNLGEDEMGLVRYTLQYSPFTGLGVSAYTRHFRPYTFGIRHALERTSIFGSQTVYKSLSPGIRKADIQTEITTAGDLYFGADAAYGFTNNRGSLALIGSPGSEKYRLAWNDITMFRNLTTKIRVNAVQNDRVYDVLRGFQYDLRKNITGVNLSVDELYRLPTKRFGFWKVPFSLEEDTYLGIFYDYSEPTSRSAAGYYLSKGTQLTIYGAGMVASIGQSFSQGESQPYVTLEFQFGVK